MKRLYIIQTFNIARPDERGFMMNPIMKTEPQIKLFTSKRSCRKYLRENRAQLRAGWGHVISPIYLSTGKKIQS